MDARTQDSPRRSDWYERRGIVVANDLDQLRGPVAGEHRLPLHLDASARALYDLADPHRRERLYEVVLLEACNERDLSEWLDAATLIEEWPRLYLPPSVRTAWEGRHPMLAARGETAAPG